MSKIKNIVIIAARANSKRLPNKNVMLFGNKPLIAHSIDYANKHSFIDKIYVTTNCSKIKNVAQDFGATVIDRPEELSGDFEPTVSAMKHVLLSIKHKVENVILLQPTNPLRPKELLNNAYNNYINNNLESLFTVTRNYDKFGKIENNVFKPFNYKIGQRSQDLDPLFYENGLIYITKAKLILEDTIISDKAFPFEVKHVYSKVDIDTLEDLNYANFILENYNNE